MLTDERNTFESEGWLLSTVKDFDKLCDFECDKIDLNEWFQSDCRFSRQELLTETYVLTEATVGKFFPVALLSLCNDAVRKEKILSFLGFTDSKKMFPVYPAVKIARFGVHQAFKRKQIGTHTMNMIKKMFITNNRTG